MATIDLDDVLTEDGAADRTHTEAVELTVVKAEDVARELSGIITCGNESLHP